MMLYIIPGIIIFSVSFAIIGLIIAIIQIMLKKLKK